MEKVYREGDKLVAVLENEYTGAKESGGGPGVSRTPRAPTSPYYELKPGAATRGR